MLFRSQLNRILLELGSEDVVLTRLADSHVFAPAQIDKIVESLAALEKLGAGVTRHGAPLAEYLDSHDAATHALPRYVARIREGNRESHQFLVDDATGADVFVSNLTVAHHAVGQTDIEPRGAHQRMRVTSVQHVVGRLAGLGDRVGRRLGRIGILAPTITDDEEDWLARSVHEPLKMTGRRGRAKAKSRSH